MGLHLILYSIRNTVTDRRCVRSHSNTPTVKKYGATDYTVQKFQVCIGSRAPHCRTVLQNGQDKTAKASPKKQSIMEYLPALPQNTKPLRSYSGNSEDASQKSSWNQMSLPIKMYCLRGETDSAIR